MSDWRKEIDVLKAIRDSGGNTKKFYINLGMSEEDIKLIVKDLNNKGINIDTDINGDVILSKVIKDIDINIVIEYIRDCGKDDYIYTEDKVNKLLRKKKINKLVKSMETVYKTNVDSRIKKLLKNFYDELVDRGLPINILDDLVLELESDKNIKELILKRKFRSKINKYINNKQKLIETEVSDNEDDNKEENFFTDEMEREMSKELYDFYINWCNDMHRLSLDDILGLEHCYDNLKRRDLPALEWFSEAYKIVLRKLHTHRISSIERCVPYFVGVIRNWQNFGRGVSGRWQDKFVMKRIEQISGFKFDSETRKDLLHLMGEEGIVAIYAAIVEYMGIGNRNGLDMYDLVNNILPNRIEKIKKSIN